jgi:hypothetical protein
MTDRPTIWTAAIDHKHGTNLYAARTAPGLYAQLASFCREWWDKDGPGFANIPPPAGDDDLLTVREYFDYQTRHGEEWHIVAEVPLSD